MNCGIAGESGNHPAWCALRLRRMGMHRGRSAPNPCGPRFRRPFCFCDRCGPRRGGGIGDGICSAGRLVRRFTGGHFGNGLRCGRLRPHKLGCRRIVYDRCRRRPVSRQSRIGNLARLKQAVKTKPEKPARQYADGKMQRDRRPSLLAVRVSRAHDAPGTEQWLDWFLDRREQLRRRRGGLRRVGAGFKRPYAGALGSMWLAACETITSSNVRASSVPSWAPFSKSRCVWPIIFVTWARHRTAAPAARANA
jgi:hypothetical protein